MPVTFCFINQQNMNVCTTGFPMGCYVTTDGKPKDACVLDNRYRNPDSYYLFNHVDIKIEYRDMVRTVLKAIIITLHSSRRIPTFWTRKLAVESSESKSNRAALSTRIRTNSTAALAPLHKQLVPRTKKPKLLTPTQLFGRKLTSSGAHDGITFWIPCLTPTFNGSLL